MNTILLNNEECVFDTTDLPVLIHGEEGSGASKFVMTVVSQLAKQSPILAITGFSMARDEFEQQTGKEIIIADKSTNPNEVIGRHIFVAREDPDIFVYLLKNLPDIDNRCILVKNIELQDLITILNILRRKKLIVNGDFSSLSNIEKMEWQTKIYFSDTKKYKVKSNLQKYEAEFSQGDNIDVIKLL